MKNVKHILFLLTVILFGILLSACEEDIDTNMSEQMEDFSFITQDKETLDLEDLKGEWWITYLSYTECRTVCPRTTVNMVDIQNKLKKENLQPQIISFNVDPENDKPEDLQAYANEYDVDLDSWDFLTGYDFKTIQNLSERSFQATLEKGAADQMSHSYMFYLINPDGEVVKKYDGMSTNENNELIADLEKVL